MRPANPRQNKAKQQNKKVSGSNDSTTKYPLPNSNTKTKKIIVRNNKIAKQILVNQQPKISINSAQYLRFKPFVLESIYYFNGYN